VALQLRLEEALLVARPQVQRELLVQQAHLLIAAKVAEEEEQTMRVLAALVEQEALPVVAAAGAAVELTLAAQVALVRLVV
jgi:hypothetical protein